MDLSKIFYENQRGINIIQFHSISVGFGSLYFLSFKAVMLELQEIFLIVTFFKRISSNKDLKARISCFLSRFLPPDAETFSNQKYRFIPDPT